MNKYLSSGFLKFSVTVGFIEGERGKLSGNKVYPFEECIILSRYNPGVLLSFLVNLLGIFLQDLMSFSGYAN